MCNAVAKAGQRELAIHTAPRVMSAASTGTAARTGNKRCLHLDVIARSSSACLGL
jgi:hypothetical protein